MGTFYYAEHVHIAQTRTRIPTPCSCIGQESESESESVSAYDGVFKPLCAIDSQQCYHHPLKSTRLMLVGVLPWSFGLKCRFYQTEGKWCGQAPPEWSCTGPPCPGYPRPSGSGSCTRSYPCPDSLSNCKEIKQFLWQLRRSVTKVTSLPSQGSGISILHAKGVM